MKYKVKKILHLVDAYNYPTEGPYCNMPLGYNLAKSLYDYERAGCGRPWPCGKSRGGSRSIIK